MAARMMPKAGAAFAAALFSACPHGPGVRPLFALEGRRPGWKGRRGEKRPQNAVSKTKMGNDERVGNPNGELYYKGRKGRTYERLATPNGEFDMNAEPMRVAAQEVDNLITARQGGGDVQRKQLTRIANERKMRRFERA